MNSSKCWDYLLIFSEKCKSEEIKGYVIDCLRRANLEIYREEFEGQTLLSIGASFDVLATKVCISQEMIRLLN